jgi:hypothetical protein
MNRVQQVNNPPDPILENVDGNKYIVAADFSVKFGYWLRELQFQIPQGFETDIASIPWWFRMVIDRASLGILAPIIHDYLCVMKGRIKTLQGDFIQVSWFDTNLLFLLLMRIDGISWPRALFAFLAVTVGSPKW